MNRVELYHQPWYVVPRRKHSCPLAMGFEYFGNYLQSIGAICTTQRYLKMFSWENMCKNKHAKARKYRRKQVAGGKIVINRRKSLIYIVYTNLFPCPRSLWLGFEDQMICEKAVEYYTHRKEFKGQLRKRGYAGRFVEIPTSESGQSRKGNPAGT